MKDFYIVFNLVVSEPWWLWGILLSVSVFSVFLAVRFFVWWQLSQKILTPWRHKKSENRKKEKAHSQNLFILLGGLVGAILGGFLWSSLGAVLGGFSVFILIWGLGKRAEFQQKQKINQQLPLFLRALGSTLKAGYSVPQALQFVAEEIENPLRERLKNGLKALYWQQPLEEVVADWRKEVNVPEFSFLAGSLVLQSRTGGNLVTLCHKVAYLLEERQKLERDIVSFTAQGKMSGLLMAGLWPISLLLFSWFSPSHTDVLFYTPAGRILLGLSLGLELLGFYFIWRLVRLKI